MDAIKDRKRIEKDLEVAGRKIIIYSKANNHSIKAVNCTSATPQRFALHFELQSSV